MADLIGADSKDIVFTSGATETNNMAIKGVARFHKEKKRHVITTQTVSIFSQHTYLNSSYRRNTNVYWIHAGNSGKKVLKSHIFPYKKMALFRCGNWRQPFDRPLPLFQSWPSTMKQVSFSL